MRLLRRYGKPRRQRAMVRAESGHLRPTLRRAMHLPYLLFLLWHDADSRWALGRSLGHESHVAQWRQAAQFFQQRRWR